MKMTRKEFFTTARTCGLDLAICAALTAGVARAVVQLWSLQA